MSGVVFNVNYMPSNGIPLSSSYGKRVNETREFYSGEGDSDIFNYMSRTEKLDQDRKKTDASKEELTPFFDLSGQITEKELWKKKQNLLINDGNIWHSFISFDKKDSCFIDTIDKAMDFIKQTVPVLYKSMSLREDFVNTICSLHLDTENHYHIHMIFWEKFPSQIQKTNSNAIGPLQYKKRGKVSKSAIQTYKKAANEYLNGLQNGNLSRSQKIKLDQKRRSLNKIDNMLNGAYENISLFKTEIKKYIQGEEPNQSEIERLRNLFIRYDKKTYNNTQKTLKEIQRVKDPNFRKSAQKRYFEAIDLNIEQFYYYENKKIETKGVVEAKCATDRNALRSKRNQRRFISSDINTLIKQNQESSIGAGNQIQTEVLAQLRKNIVMTKPEASL